MYHNWENKILGTSLKIWREYRKEGILDTHRPMVTQQMYLSNLYDPHVVVEYEKTCISTRGQNIYNHAWFLSKSWRDFILLYYACLHSRGPQSRVLCRCKSEPKPCDFQHSLPAAITTRRRFQHPSSSQSQTFSFLLRN